MIDAMHPPALATERLMPGKRSPGRSREAGLILRVDHRFVKPVLGALGHALVPDLVGINQLSILSRNPHHLRQRVDHMPKARLALAEALLRAHARRVLFGLLESAVHRRHQPLQPLLEHVVGGALLQRIIGEDQVVLPRMELIKVRRSIKRHRDIHA